MIFLGKFNIAQNFIPIAYSIALSYCIQQTIDEVEALPPEYPLEDVLKV
jgi:hypothetical protein